MALQRQGRAFLSERRSSLSAAHVAELCAELQPLLAGWTVKDVQGLPPRDVLLILEPPGGAEEAADGPPILRLRLAADPNAPRLHLQQGRVQRHEGPVGPFFQKLAEQLVGVELRRIAPVRADRIAIAEFRGVGGEHGGERGLILELFGRRANLCLVGAGDEILALAQAPPKREGEQRPRLAVGEPWTPPDAGSPPRGAAPSIAATFPEPDAEPPGRVKDRAPLSWRIECALGEKAAEDHAEEARRKLRQRVKRKLKGARGLVRGLESKRAAAEGAERVLQDGELLKAALGTFERGATEVATRDWFAEGAPERRIEVDPKLSPNENVARLFDRYHRLERARASVDEEIERAHAKVAALEELDARAHGDDVDGDALDREAVERGLLDPIQVADARKRKRPEPRKPYRAFKGSKGSDILVGRTARDNDTLTVRIARGSDYWFHTADVPGSHVVLRTPRHTDPDSEEILDAAHLAIHFSPVRGTDRAPVHMAQRKHIQKPKGAKAGLVTLSGGRILEVRVQQERLNGLLRGDR